MTTVGFPLHAHTQAMFDGQPGGLSAGGVDYDLLARFTRLAPLVVLVVERVGCGM